MHSSRVSRPPWSAGDCFARARLAIAAAFATLLLPLTVESARYFLLDQPVALIVGLAAIAWLAAAERPSWLRYALFGTLAIFATLVKGNGALVVLIPAIEIGLSRRWRLLADAKLWVVGAATLLLILPWYLISFRISAGGFNYEPGIAYAWASLTANGTAIQTNIGWTGLLLASIGAIHDWRDPRSEPVVRIALATILATLIFQGAVPVALADRYILPLLPWCVILAALGVRTLWNGHNRGRLAATACVVGALIIPVATLARMPLKPDLGAPAIAQAMIDTPGIWLVDGRAGGEGAVIAAVAHADRGQRRIWVARASQWLSTSDFMGRGYALTARSPREARATLDRLGARGVVLVAERRKLAYPHSGILQHAVRQSGYHINPRSFAVGHGATLTAARDAPVLAHPELLMAGSGSHNFSAMTAEIQ